MASHRSRLLGLVALTAGLGCVGKISDGQGGPRPGAGGAPVSGGGPASPTASGGSGGAMAGGAASGGSPGVALDCSQPQAAVTRLQLLTSSQYDNSVLDLLGVGGSPGAGIGDAVFATLDDTAVEQRAGVAATVAATAAASLSKWSPCTPPATGSTAACEQQIISTVGANLYRRPLSSAEQAELKTLFDAGVKEKDFPTGVEWFLTGVLQSPDFMYQIVRPDPAETPGQVRPLAPVEYASRLAYFVWNSPPDSQLMAAAANNDFADATKRQAQLTRMIQDARFSRGIDSFYRRWLNIDGFDELARDPTGFDQNVVTALATSLLMSATQIYGAASPNISSLFSGQTYYMNDVLRSFYGLSGSGTSFAPVSMPNQSRRGILTHPGLMALLARPSEDNPVSRGLFLLRNVLCIPVPPPPQNLVTPPLPPIAPGSTTRQRLSMHATDPVCASCHNTIDPMGFAFENFDEVGRYRTTDQGLPVDSSGTIAVNMDIDGPFATGDDLLARFADSASVRSCFAEKYLDFALAFTQTDPSEACSIQSIGQTFDASGDLKQLVASVAASDSFTMRLAEGVQ